MYEQLSMTSFNLNCLQQVVFLITQILVNLNGFADSILNIPNISFAYSSNVLRLNRVLF